jgi:hypothetical protein
MNTEIKETIMPIPFMGVGFSDNGPSDPRINKALEKTYALLDIMEFIKVTKFELNEVMFDYFWQVMVGNTPIHLGRRVLEWFGYEGEIFSQKQKFVSMLKRNDIGFTELASDNKEIELYPTIKVELAFLPSNIKNSKFLVMEPRNLKKAIMKLNTKNGNAIREYYVDVEDLMKLYVEYTLYYNQRESQRKITDLELMMADMKLENAILMKRQEEYLQSMSGKLDDMITQNEEIQENLAVVQDKLDISVEDRCPKVQTNNRLEQFVLIKKNTKDKYPFYVICGQQIYVTSRTTLLRRRYPNMTTLLKLEYQPNTKNLFGRFKETHKEDVNVRMNDIQLVSISEQELVEAFEKLDDDKTNV